MAVTIMTKMYGLARTQNRIYTPYMTVYLVISLPKMPYINRIFMVWPTLIMTKMYLSSAAVLNCAAAL